MHAASHIPRPALVLGWLGVLPFSAFTLLAVTGAVMLRTAAINALMLYGVVIASFMAGAPWGLAMVAARNGAAAIGPRLAISVLPALAAIGLWYLPPTPALLGLAAVFCALLMVDIATARQGAAPARYPTLRVQLTGAVVTCLLLAALLGAG
jgi:hypothetical protein